MDSLYERGADFSRWDGKIDWAKYLIQQPTFCILRAGYGARVLDDLWLTNRHKPSALNLLYGVYYVPAPAEPIATERGLLDVILMNYPIPRFIALDLEIYHANLFHRAVALAEYVEGEFNIPVLIYTNADTRKKFYGASLNTAIFKYPLWVAHWTTASKPILPLGWSDWLLWQYSANGNRLGASWGVSARDVDINRVNPRVTSLRTWLDGRAA